MRKASPIWLLVLLITISGCIERYFPDEEELKPGTLVIVAHLTSLPGEQSVYVSRSASISQTLFNPVVGCLVEVTRSDGETRIFNEAEEGRYSSDLDASFLISGYHYSLRLVTPDGSLYISDMETLNPAPAIDSVYFEIEQVPGEEPGTMEDGIRFYMDFEIDKDSSRYLRWFLKETYEILNPDYPTIMFDKDRRFKELPDSILWRRCWITNELPAIHTVDLRNISGDTYRRYPLNFVSGQTRRLHERYCLQIVQLSLSESAFWYWDELSKNIQSGTVLFDRQPSLTPSNIFNQENEEELIIGYFSISGAVETRAFVDYIPGLDLYWNPELCAPGLYPAFLHRFPRDKLPVYIATATINGETTSGMVHKECVDCRETRHSTNIKPDFW